MTFACKVRPWLVCICVIALTLAFDCSPHITKDAPPTATSLTSAILRISYDGSRFTGWSAANDPKSDNDKSIVDGNSDIPFLLQSGRSRQRRGTIKQQQGFVRSVQGVLQSNLAKLYGNVALDRIVVEGCSRTDKGVHALELVALVYCLHANYSSVDYNNTVIPGKRLPHPNNATDSSCFEPLALSGDLSKMAFTLNRMLSPEVRVVAIAPPPQFKTFHPTLSAVAKTYRYTLSVGPYHDPTQWRFVWHLGNTDLDMKKINQAASLLRGRHDFAAFSGAPRSFQDKQKRLTQCTFCTLHNISVDTDASTTTLPQLQTISISITGDRFLYKMMRFLVGALVAVGKDDLSVQEIDSMLSQHNQVESRPSFTCAPAHGLVLANVHFQDPISWIPASS